MALILTGLAAMAQAVAAPAPAAAPNVAALCEALDRRRDPSAQNLHNLATCLFRGHGLARDLPRARSLYERAAARGNVQSQTDLGGYLLMGRVMPKDAVEARRWLTSAARQRQANAAMLLGQIYWNGDGVAKDNGEAARWWRVAYDGGRVDAANLLAREALVRMTLATTEPEDVDRLVLAEALRWFEIAAETDPAESVRREARETIAPLRYLQSLPAR